MNLRRIVILLVVLMLTVPMTFAQSSQTPQEICDASQPAELTEMQFEAPEQVLEAGVDYRAIFCTGAGAVYIDLFEDLTPQTVNNFVFLAQQGYYDSTTFHRVIESFMAQAGDPTATGRGGPGYQFEDEFVGFLGFDRPGLLAMANAGANTNGSQFFITTAPTPHLNYRHTIFGEVLEGQENVENIQLRDPETATEPGEALNAIVIVTDPAAVESDYDVLPPATQEEVVAAIEDFLAQVPPQIALDEEVSGLFTTEETISSVPDEFESDFSTFAETYGHQYRYSARLLNAECDPQQFFTSLRFTMDAMGSAEDARNALADDFPMTLATSNGFEAVEGAENTYMQSAETCSGGDGVYGMGLYTRGRYLITVEAIVPVEILQQVDMETLLQQGIASPFETVLGVAFLPEIRSE